MTFDPSKSCRTKRGDAVEIISVNGREPYPIIGYVENRAEPDVWTKDGKFTTSGCLTDTDLVNLPQEIDVWLNVYKSREEPLLIGVPYYSREEADLIATSDRVACIRVKLVEGQFDD